MLSLIQKRRIKLLQSSAFLTRVRLEDPYMISLIPSLISMNKLGFITIDSQSGREESGISNLNQLPYQIMYRSYVFGVMTNQLAKSFTDRFNYPHLRSLLLPIVSYEPSVGSDISLTISLKSKKKTIETHMSKVLPKRIADSYLTQLGFTKNSDVVFVFCWDSKWLRPAFNNDGLFTAIIKTLS